MVKRGPRGRPQASEGEARSTTNLQLSTRTPADYPIYWPKADAPVGESRGSFRG
jgi:hypothetical protein